MRSTPIGIACLTSAFLVLIAIRPAGAADTPTFDVLPTGGTVSLRVPLFKSRVLRAAIPAARVSVGNPDIADLLILGEGELYVLGKDLGTTNVLLWDRRNQPIGTVEVEVTHDLEALKLRLHQLFPGDAIEAYSVQRSIALRGRVQSLATMEAALRIAEGYLAQVQTDQQATQFKQDESSRREDKTVGRVINLMHVAGAQQVMLEVKVAEIARTELKRLDAQFNALNIDHSKWAVGGVNGGARFPDVVFEPVRIPDGSGGTIELPGGRSPVFSRDAPWGPAIKEFAPNDMAIQDQGFFASFLSETCLFNLALDAAKEKGLAKILAEPTLTTLTGQEARFLSGGEFPIPVPRGDDGITVTFKEFGVGLTFLPVVLGAGIINIKVNVSVSELVNANSIGIRTPETSVAFVVPSLAKRSVLATVELREGQTMGLAGLINDNVREVVTKFPGLGDLPVLGALFRSQEFLKNETELVILVTPKLAKPMSPDNIRLPTDRFYEPTDTDFYLMGRTEGSAPRNKATQ